MILPNVTTTGAGKPGQTSAKLTGSIDPLDGGNITECYFEYGTDTSYSLGQVPCEQPTPYAAPSEVSAEIIGLTPETTYHYRLVAANGNGLHAGGDQVFTPHHVIALSTGPQTNLTATSVTLDGSFVGNGEDIHYYFKWGTSADFGHTTATPPGVDAGSQAGPTNVSFNLTELLPGTAYQYQIIATNASGTTEGEINRFTTPPLPPVITGETASGVQSDLASLHAEIDPDGAETTYHFEFGTEPCNTGPNFCISTPIPDASVGSASSFQGVSVQLNGLMQGTTYHYRVVAKNEVETTYGQDHTFTTYSVPQFSASCPNARVRQQTGAALLPDCRAYELVSAAQHRRL